jgi:Flp pilus assembly protein TadG
MIEYMKKSLKRKEGQSAIEFIVVVVVILFFLLFFMCLSILWVVSDYLEYATFMAARTYKSMFSSREVQERNARTVFNSYAQKVQGLARNFNLEFVPGPTEGGEQSAGVIATYTMDLFYLPPLFLPDGLPGSAITLKSETHLGRDAAYEDCIEFYNQFGQKVGIPIQGTNFVRQMDDNGC